MQDKRFKDTINIIAAGNSVSTMDVKEICRRAYTIGVNGAAIHAPVNIGISVDRKWAEEYTPAIKGRPFFLYKYSEIWPELFLYDWTNRGIFSEIPGILDGQTSGHVALNLAYQMYPKKIYLFGFDYTGKGYWFGGYKWTEDNSKSRTKAEWLQGFDVIKTFFDKRNISVKIVGETKIRDFPVISYKDYLNETKDQ